MNLTAFVGLYDNHKRGYLAKQGYESYDGHGHPNFMGK
ncbi:hypothetical protein MTsPCn5_17660 [Croceitalea sp. MTPC5]|nr:hypothetical protein MTsPCn5_17660 [Croceitalea sp. MTPC5]